MKKFDYYAMEQFNVRSFSDRRRKVNRIVCSYRDEKGYEYRKSFEFPVEMKMSEMQSLIPATM